MSEIKETDGQWHELLNELRRRFRHRMDGDISQQQRGLGLEYGINFGVSIMHLKEIASELPHDSGLADIMWMKDVREMKLLSLLVRPTADLTHEKVLELCQECPTREIAEQLVLQQMRHITKDTEEALLLKIYDLDLLAEHPASIVPYLYLIQLANKGVVSVGLINKLLSIIGRDLGKEDMAYLTALNNSLTRLAEEPKLRPALMHIASVAISSLPEGSSGHAIAQNLKAYLLEL